MTRPFLETEPNLATISLWLRIQELTELSKNPILPFSEATSDNLKHHIFYDETRNINNDGDFEAHPVVLNALIDEIHHDIVSTYHSAYPSLDISVIITEDSSDPYLRILDLQSGIEVVIEDGFCYES